MNSSANGGDAADTIDVENHSLLQICIVLYRKIMWNTAFNEISTLEGDLHRQLREFGDKQIEYMGKVNGLLNLILSGEGKQDFFMYTAIEKKYSYVEKELMDFKGKLSKASRYAEKGRIEWLDGFLLNRVKFIKLSENEQKAVVKRSKEGDRVIAKARSMFNELMVNWIKMDLEDRLTDFTRHVGDLLRGGKISVNDCSTLIASKKRTAKALRKRALRTIRKRTAPYKVAEPRNSSQE